MIFDCVIPFGPNDESIVNICIEKAKENLVGLRDIYVVSYRDDFRHHLATTISEKSYPFKMEDIRAYIKPQSRSGWYFQQLLKMYSHIAIPELSEYFLILDSDTVFVKKTSMFDTDTPLYNTGTEYHLPYFTHMNRLYETFKKTSPDSGICHHMIFKKEYLNEIFKMVEEKHSDVFWRLFLKFTEGISSESGASEYEIYFTFLHLYKKDSFKIRKLNFKNTHSIEDRDSDTDYVSIHYYMRK